MNAELKITEQDLIAIVSGIIKIASNKDSGCVFTFEMSRDLYWISIDIRYEYDIKEVIGGSFEYFNGQVEYERYYEVINEHYTIESIYAFCEETELQVPEYLEKRLTEMLNN